MLTLDSIACDAAERVFEPLLLLHAFWASHHGRGGLRETNRVALEPVAARHPVAAVGACESVVAMQHNVRLALVLGTHHRRVPLGGSLVQTAF